MADIDFDAFDADNHYYEAIDAFTRHLDPKLGPRCVQWADIDGRKYHVIGGRISRAVVNATFDPIAKAGAMHDYFRGNPDQKSPLEFLRDREPIRPEYRDRDARLTVMDEHGLEKIWLFPTLGILYEELLKDDIFAVNATFTAFNRWLEDDWGCNYQDRIYASPYISLADPEWAIGELEWAIEHDARTIVMRPAAPTTIRGQLSPFDPYFDPFWKRVNDTGITVIVHAGDSGYSSQGYAKDGFGATFEGAGHASIKMFNIERAAYDFLITAMFERLFDRFPNVRLASVENGSEFLPELFKKLRSTERKMPGYYSGDPVEQFREHVWINPFWEDDVNDIVDLMGSDRVIFGSDWPHIEGMPRPLDYAAEVKGFTDEDQRRILRDNALELNERRPV
jgi:predicted TIM-barrel fold metal-dependent hydrolase